MDHLGDLIAFTTVVESGSFTAAAERLDANKSAVSRRLSALEKRLGVQLIRRTTRSLNVTETGQSFYERAARILADLEEAESAVAQAHGELRGRLRIALPLTFGVLHMCTPIDEFNRKHPNVIFDLDLSDRRVDLLQEGIDVAVRIGRLEDSSLIARKLFDTRTVVCASPDYLEEHGRPKTPDELADHDCLVYSNLREPDRWRWIDEHGESRQVDVRVRMSANSGDLLGNAAADGLGIVMQPTFIAHRHVRSGALQPILTDVDWPGPSAWAVYPPARHLSYRVRAFIDFLADYFADTPYWDKDCNELGHGGR
jgi:DNA-binding transcriptional LysR family regulator